MTRSSAAAMLLLSCLGLAEAFAPAKLPAMSRDLQGGLRTFASSRHVCRHIVMQDQSGVGDRPRPAGPKPLKGPTLAPILPVLAVLLAPAVAGAEPPEWLEDTRSQLDIGLAIFSLLFFLRIPLTWYPQMDLKKFPQAIVAMWVQQCFVTVSIVVCTLRCACHGLQTSARRRIV